MNDFEQNTDTFHSRFSVVLFSCSNTSLTPTTYREVLFYSFVGNSTNSRNTPFLFQALFNTDTLVNMLSRQAQIHSVHVLEWDHRIALMQLFLFSHTVFID